MKKKLKVNEIKEIMQVTLIFPTQKYFVERIHRSSVKTHLTNFDYISKKQGLKITHYRNRENYLINKCVCHLEML